MNTTLRAVSIGIQANEAVLVMGQPGGGKTATIVAICRELGRHCEVITPSNREPADIGGYPYPDLERKIMRFLPPEFAARLVEAKNGVLFIDEMTNLPRSLQAVCLRLILDKVAGDVPLPITTAVIAAANPPESAAEGHDLSAPLANRLCHLTWDLPVADWADAAIAGFPNPSVPRLPTSWPDRIPLSTASVAAYLRHRPQAANVMPVDTSKRGEPWPSYRTWTVASRLAAAAQSAGDGDAEMLLIGGCVGPGHAAEYLTWRRSLDLPDPEWLLAHPSKFELPKRGDQQFAVLAAVASATLDKLTKERWAAAWDIMGSAASQGAKDIAAVAVRALGTGLKQGMSVPSNKVMAPFIDILKRAGLMGATS